MTPKDAPRQKTDVRRKRIRVDQAKLDRVRSALGARSDHEAIDRALDMILLSQDLVAGIESIAGTGGVDNVFDD